jgi:hypothetical protein
MRIATFPILRIAAGLLLAVLLSVVGYQVVRRLNSHGPEALLKRADNPLCLNIWIQAESSYRQTKLQFIQSHRLLKALSTRLSQLPVHTNSSNSVPDLRLDEELSGFLESRSNDGIDHLVRPRTST